MSNYIWDLLSLPIKKYNTRAVRNATTEVSADEFNGMVQAISDLRAAVRTGTLKDVSATVLSAANEVRKRVVNGWEEMSRNGLGWRRTVISVHVGEFGARPWDPDFDNGPRFQAAFERMVTDGVDGYLETDPGDAYWFQTEYIHGRRWILPADVYKKAPDYALAASYDSAAYSAARLLPRVGFKGNGAILVADLDRTGAPKALFSSFIGESHTKPNQDHFKISGLHIVGVDAFDGITPNFSGSPLSADPLETDNNMVGFFSVLSPAKIDGCSMRDFARGGVVSDCYSGTRHNVTASRCTRGLEYLNDNGTASFGNKATLCGVGFTGTGQAPTHVGYISEQNEVAVEVPSCDGITFLGGYDENTTAGHTDFRVKLGEVADVNTAQAIKAHFIGWHMFGTYGKPVQFRSAPYARFTNCRSYTTGAVVYDGSSSVLIDGYPMDFTASAFVTAGVTQFCPAAPGGTLQIGGGSGTTGIAFAQGTRFYPDPTVYFYGDGSGRHVVIGGGYYSGNLEIAGQGFFNTINGPGGTTTWLWQNNTTDGASALGFDFSASAALANAAARIARWRSAGSTRMSLFGLGDLELHAVGKGLIVNSPDGTKRARISLDNAGALALTAL